MSAPPPKRMVFWPVLMIATVALWLLVWITEAGLNADSTVPAWLNIPCNVGIFIAVAIHIWRGRYPA